MNCPKCGAENSDNAKFCRSCGGSLSIESQGASQQPFTPPSYTYTPTETPQEPPKKKRKGAKVLSIILAIIVVIAIVAVFAWQFIARAAIGNIEFYLWREATTVSDFFKVDNFGDLFSSDSFTADSKITASVDGEDAEDYATALSKASANIKTSYDSKSETGSLSGSIAYDGTDIADVTLGYIENQLNISSDYTDAFSAMNIPELEDLPDYEDALGEMIVIIKQSEKAAFSSDDVKTSVKMVDGKLCNVVTIQLTEENCSKLAQEILTRVKDDDKVMNFVKECIKYYNANAEEFDLDTVDVDDTYDEFVSTIDEAIEDISDSDSDEDIAEIQVAYSLFGKVVSRTIDFEDEGTLEITNNSKELNVKYDDEFEATFTKEKSKGAYNGKLVFKTSSYDYESDSTSLETLFTFEYSDFKIEKVNGVAVILGEAKLDVPSDYETLKVNLTAEEKDDKYDITANVDYSEEDSEGTTVKVNISSDLSNKADVSSVKKLDSSKAVDIESFGESLGEGITDKIENNSELLESLSELFGYGYSYDDYDYGYDYDYDDDYSSDSYYDYGYDDASYYDYSSDDYTAA